MEETTEQAQGGSWATIIGVVLVAIFIIVCFSIFHMRQSHDLSKDAVGIARNFIRNSPVIDQNLGAVHAVQATSERSGGTEDSPTYALDFNVSGAKATGIVKVDVAYARDQWQVQSGDLDLNGKTYNLR
jgi:hypothetical protein